MIASTSKFGRGDQSITPAVFILLRVESHSKELQPLATARPQTRRVLADASSERHRIQSAHGGRVRSDGLLHLIGEHSQRPARCFRVASFQIPNIAAGDPGGMLALAAGLGGQLRDGFEAVRSVSGLPSGDGITSVVMCGMGGSGIAGESSILPLTD